MNKIKEIIQIFNCNNDGNININNLINILDNLTNVERNVVFNKLYNHNNSYCCKIYNHNGNNNCKYGNKTILQKIYSDFYNGREILIYVLKKYKNNININIKNLQGKTLLYYIILKNDIKMLELIYELYKDININILDDDNDNILYTIFIDDMMNRDKEIIRLLLEKNIKIQYNLLKYIIHVYNHEEKYYNKYINGYIDIILEYLHKNDDYDYMLEELYKYVKENVEINEDNKEFYDKIFAIKSSTKSAAKILNN